MYAEALPIKTQQLMPTLQACSNTTLGTGTVFQKYPPGEFSRTAAMPRGYAYLAPPPMSY